MVLIGIVCKKTIFCVIESIDMSGGRETGPGFFSEREPPGPRFVNLYMGSGREKLDFNRRVIEGFLKLTTINKTVILAEGQNGYDLNKDGTNQFARVKSEPGGYRIEIVGNQNQDVGFAESFNKHLRSSLRVILVREKLTQVKNFKDKVAASFMPPAIMSPFRLIDGFDNNDIPLIILTSLLGNAVFNVNGKLDFNFPLGRKSLSAKYEYFMPAIEVDRLVAGLVYLNTRGRNLVRAKD